MGGLLSQEDLTGHTQRVGKRPSVANIAATTYIPSAQLRRPDPAGDFEATEQVSLDGVAYQSAEYVRRCAGVVRQAVASCQPWLADPRFNGEGWRDVLNEDFSAGQVDQAPTMPPLAGDTIALCVVDRDGMGVSLIESIYHDFGSGVYVEPLGIFLQNRGASFSLNSEHPNCLAPAKRPAHTLTPALVCDATNDLFMVLGTRGGAGQPQTLTQVLSAVLDYGLDVQEALSGPRWVYGSTTSARRADGLILEKRISPRVFDKMAQEGIPVQWTDDLSAGWMGSAQAIVVDKRSTCLYGGADPRGGGLAQGI